MKHAEICAYELPGEVRIERATQRDGRHKWAVRRAGSCLNRDSEFEYEPLPSSRDDEFLARCRFDSAESAYAAWESYEASGRRGCVDRRVGRQAVTTTKGKS